MNKIRKYLYTAIAIGFAIVVGAFGLFSHRAKGQDSTTKTPVQFMLSCIIPTQQLICNNQVTVPAGKQLIIEFVSARVSISSDQSPQLRVLTPSFNLAVPGGTINLGHYIALNLSPRIPNSADSYYASQIVRLYSMQGGTITIEGRRFNTATGTANFDVTFSGYLIDLP
jgi:hypothetical protein